MLFRSGYDLTEIVGKNFIELAHKDDLSRRAEWFSELRKGVESPSEYRIINPDFPLGDFSHISEAAVITVAGMVVTCSNGNH